MKLRNKKTGDIVRVEFLNNYQSDDGTEIGFRVANTLDVYSYASLAELNAEWEDYEEPKESKKYWYIDSGGETVSYYEEDEEPEDTEACKEIGNYFETEEEAEKAVEKLRAWKVLKDMGFKIAGIRYRNNKNYVEWSIPQKVRDDYYAVSAFNEALHLLFGGEE